MASILTSIEGRKIGLDHKGNLIVNLADGGSAGNDIVKTITTAQVLTMFTTPIELVPAPATGFAHLLRRIQIHKPAGVAYVVAAGTDLVAKYTNAAGGQASSVIETTGFVDQTTVQYRVAGVPGSTGATAGDVIPVSAAALVLHVLTANLTTGDQPLYVRVHYDTVKLAFTS